MGRSYMLLARFFFFHLCSSTVATCFPVDKILSHVFSSENYTKFFIKLVLNIILIYKTGIKYYTKLAQSVHPSNIDVIMLNRCSQLNYLLPSRFVHFRLTKYVLFVFIFGIPVFVSVQLKNMKVKIE
jgi:hypothetical protein